MSFTDDMAEAVYANNRAKIQSMDVTSFTDYLEKTGGAGDDGYDGLSVSVSNGDDSVCVAILDSTHLILRAEIDWKGGDFRKPPDDEPGDEAKQDLYIMMSEEDGPRFCDIDGLRIYETLTQSSVLNMEGMINAIPGVRWFNRA